MFSLDFFGLLQCRSLFFNQLYTDPLNYNHFRYKNVVKILIY